MRPPEGEDLCGLRRHRLAARGRDQPIGHRLVHDLVESGAQQICRTGERSQPLTRRRIDVQPSLDLAPLRHLEFAVQIGDETVVTALLHP